MESFTCISFMKNLFKEWFCRKNFCFCKILIFKGLIDWTCFLISRSQFWNFSIGIRFLFDRSIENFPFLKSGFYQLRLMFDRCLINWNGKIFDQSIFIFVHHLWQDSHAFNCFLYPSYSFAVISLIFVTHNMHTLLNWVLNLIYKLID